MPTFISHGVYARAQCAVRLEGVHHITLITGDAPRNVEFYTGVLGLRLVKKTVNQDDPTVYHLFYADEKGSAGSDITFFEYPGAARGRAGAGMIHTIVWRVASPAALDFWESAWPDGVVRVRRRASRSRIRRASGTSSRRQTVRTSRSSPSIPEIPEEHALQGFDGVRAYAIDPDRSSGAARGDARLRAARRLHWEARGDQRGGFYAYDAAPEGRGIPGAGTVHHVAWATHDGRARGLAAARRRGRPCGRRR